MESVTNLIGDKEALVDPFLVEAVQNPRHRLTILRMELDIQRFLQSTDQQFEFQHFPTSYLRLAAHRVAQHYGLTTMVQDNGIDGLTNKIVVKKTTEGRYPTVRLTEIPAKQSETGKPEHVKIAVRPRPHKGSPNGSGEFGTKRSPARSVEERKEEYERARARIFSGSSSLNSDDRVPQANAERRSESPRKDENEGSTDSTSTLDKSINIKDGSSRIAILRDREKDLTDPDYDRNYERYVRSSPINQSFSVAPYNVQKVQFPYVQYENGYPQLGQMPRTQASLNYRSAVNPAFNPFCAVGSNQTAINPGYVQWPSASMMYAHSYEQFAHRVFQAPFCQQPLSFDYSQNR